MPKRRWKCLECFDIGWVEVVKVVKGITWITVEACPLCNQGEMPPNGKPT